jgi:hypothetical protein
MKSGVFWQVVISFKADPPLSWIAESRAEAVRAIQELPKSGGIPFLYKLAFYKGRIYAKRQFKIV